MEQGKGILHPNNLIDELDNIVCDDAARLSLKDGPFSEVLKAAQVSPFSFYLVTDCYNLCLFLVSCFGIFFVCEFYKACNKLLLGIIIFLFIMFFFFEKKKSIDGDMYRKP